MAFIKQEKKNLNALPLISQYDSALDFEKCNYDEYIETLQESHLSFLDDQQPTRFLLNMKLTAKQEAAISNAMLASQDDSGRPTMSLGSLKYAVAKQTLKGITNPANLEPHERIDFKTDKNGLAHDDVLAEIGPVLNDILSVYTSHVQTSVRKHSKNL